MKIIKSKYGDNIQTLSFVFVINKFPKKSWYKYYDIYPELNYKSGNYVSEGYTSKTFNMYGTVL